MKIPLCIPNIDEREEKAVLEVLKSGWFAHGPKNKEFEEDWARKFGVKHAVVMNSCASTLHAAIAAHNIKGEVIVPSFTFVASVNAIITAGATPVFVDIEPDTHNIDPSKIEDLITSETEAIMPIHWAGQVCNMTAVMEIAQKHNLVVIEDSAESIGGQHKGKLGGTFATGCFSFYPGKNMTTGEGGMFTTNDDEVAEKARTLMGHGISKTTLDRHTGEAQPWIRSAIMPGFNFRMSNILAALGVVQLKKLDEMNEKRRQHAAYYMEGLKGNNAIELPFEHPDSYHTWQMFTIKVKDAHKRDDFVMALRENGIGASVHFDPPVHLMPVYNKVKNAENLPITEDVFKRVVTLPMFPQMTNNQLDYVIEHTNHFFK